VISRATPAFWRAYDNLNASERESARRAFRLFSTNFFAERGLLREMQVKAIRSAARN
jgi:hypothetical protein